jgi:uncharacterized protein YceH (UPF0502 family)
MTLKGLVSACNQSSSRWPVVAYDDGTVQRTLDQLKADGLVRFVHPSHGERSTKFRQVLDERLALEPEQAAVVCVLLLRGALTAGELRSRTERLHAFRGTDEVDAVLRGLAARDEPLALLLPRRSGEREARWIHLLGRGDLAAEAAVPRGTYARPSLAPIPRGPALAPPSSPSSNGALEERVAALEAKVARLYDLLGEEG